MKLSKDLVDVVTNITDPKDPTSMEKLLPFFDEVIREDEEFLEILVKNLDDAQIYWDQPWYQRHGKISRPPVFEEVDENNTYLTGTITQDERAKIEKNWRKFIKKYDLPDKLISICRWKNVHKDFKSPQERARKFVVSYLARGLKRNLYQVLKHITTYYPSHSKCEKYSSIEDKVIQICVHHNPNGACRFASVILSREPRAIYNRIKFIRNGKPEKKRIKWKLSTASKLVRSILKHSNLKELEELKYAKFNKSVWINCQNDMDHNYIKLQQFWHNYLHVQLFVDCDVKMYRLKKTLFKRIRARNYKVWTDIQWKEILQDFPDGMTQSFLYIMAQVVVRDYRDYRTRPLDEVIDHGLQKIKVLKSRNKRLKRLILEDGWLKVRPVVTEKTC